MGMSGSPKRLVKRQCEVVAKSDTAHEPAAVDRGIGPSAFQLTANGCSNFLASS